MTEPLLSCRGLVIGHGRHALLPAFDLDVGRGELVAVIGRNGAGKSTWIRTVLGELRPLAGTVTRPTGARAAYVPQASSSALDRVLPIHGRAIAGWGRLRGWSFLRPWSSRADRAARDRALADAEATELARAPYRELSGGQRQRVLFARLLASEAELALLDEPTAAMDMSAEQEAYARLRALATDRGLGVVVITHTLGAVAGFADRVVFFDRGEGGTVMTGTPAEVFADPVFRRHFGEVPVG